VEPNHSQLSLRRQRALLGIRRASLYYEPVEESRWQRTDNEDDAIEVGDGEQV
jgi:hypothetical protein